eukprot:CCRYP_007770-RA/>CCRYP_007770-RA protein AED:0.59 eAED:0.43 QI:0/0/0/1/0/0/2/0/125
MASHFFKEFPMIGQITIILVLNFFEFNAECASSCDGGYSESCNAVQCCSMLCDEMQINAHSFKDHCNSLFLVISALAHTSNICQSVEKLVCLSRVCQFYCSLVRVYQVLILTTTQLIESSKHNQC